MESTFELHPHWVQVRFFGNGTPEETKVAFRRSLEMAESAGLECILIDSRDSRVHPGFDAMRDLADFALSLKKTRLPRTAVVVRGPLQYGLARMFGALVEFEDWEFRIFRSNESAGAWLVEERSEA